MGLTRGKVSSKDCGISFNEKGNVTGLNKEGVNPIRKANNLYHITEDFCANFSMEGRFENMNIGLNEIRPIVPTDEKQTGPMEVRREEPFEAQQAI